MADQPMLPSDDATDKALFEGAMAPAPEPAAPIAEPTPPAPEPAAEPAPPVVEPPKPPAEEHIPAWRLREEAEGRRRAEDRARQLEEYVTRMNAQAQQQTKPPDFFENPNQATQALVQAALAPHAEEVRRNLLYMGRMVASQAHGADKVDAAENSFLEEMRNGRLDPSEYERVVTSPNRYDAVVQWHKRQTVLSSVGDDPSAWFEKQLEARMADPAFQAKMMEKIGKGAATRPGVVSLPPSLSKVTASAGNAVDGLGDMSDQSLFAYAMKR